MTQIERITSMEQLLDECTAELAEFCTTLDKLEATLQKLRKLEAYYSSLEWMSDYDDSNSGKLPKNLKCGVLSEDAIYDLLEDRRAAALKMAETSLNILKGE